MAQTVCERAIGQWSLRQVDFTRLTGDGGTLTLTSTYNITSVQVRLLACPRDRVRVLTTALPAAAVQVFDDGAVKLHWATLRGLYRHGVRFSPADASTMTATSVVGTSCCYAIRAGRCSAAVADDGVTTVCWSSCPYAHTTHQLWPRSTAARHGQFSS
jgi:hypothetical protein